jgi:ribosomal protein S18 acetylase RimI-like enzyme
MTALRPMSEGEFKAWREEAIPNFAKEKVRSGQWAAAESLALSRQAHDELLPQGLSTPDNHFYTIVDDDLEPVGTLWFAVKVSGNTRIAYVFDVRIFSKHRRKGHALRAFEWLEREVIALNLSGIALHVFGHNIAAQALYAKLGFEATNINLIKRVSTK